MMPSRRDTPAGPKRGRARTRENRRLVLLAAWPRHLLRVPALLCMLAVVLFGAGVAVARILPHASAAPARPTPQLIERLDAHVDDLANMPDFEMDLSLSQTIDDCGAPLRGQFCLRYSITNDDVPVQAGYGLIPASQVRVHGSTITLVTNTARDRGFVHVAGRGGLISITWTAPRNLPIVASRSAAMGEITARGSIIGTAIPSSDVTAAVVIHGAP